MRNLLIGICLTLAVAACATQPGVSPNATPATAKKAGCVPGTIPAPDDCKYPGAVYTKKEMQQTGATNTADALRLLDPSIQIR